MHAKYKCPSKQLSITCCEKEHPNPAKLKATFMKIF